MHEVGAYQDVHDFNMSGEATLNMAQFVNTIDILHLHCFGHRLVEEAHPKQCKCRMSIG